MCPDKYENMIERLLVTHIGTLGHSGWIVGQLDDASMDRRIRGWRKYGLQLIRALRRLDSSPVSSLRSVVSTSRRAERITVSIAGEISINEYSNCHSDCGL
jgi:hypothetical protein